MYYHKNLTLGTWGQRDFAFQMANIGSEFSRMINWLQKGNKEHYDNAMFRGLELLDMTITLAPNHKKRELCRLRENCCELWIKEDIQELKNLLKYFDYFALVCRSK